MLFFLGGKLQKVFGPARLLQSYTVLLGIALYAGFFLTMLLLPKCYALLPHDRGREFTLTAKEALGKPTGAGVVFITLFVAITALLVPLSVMQAATLLLTWVMMLTGFLDDRSQKSWGEYRKGLLDLIVSALESLCLYYCLKRGTSAGAVNFWLPFFSAPITVNAAVYVAIGTVLLWTSINTTNCTDGVDGLSGTLVLIALITLGGVFYFILGHKGISSYLLVPHLPSGANWAVLCFALAGTLMGYLWHNAYPSSVLMGDAGSRALGFFIGSCVLVTGNPLLILATSTIIFLNGGTGLLKVALLRFLHIRILSGVRFPLHDEMRKNHGWSPTQVLLKFMVMQLLVTVFLVGVFFKIR